MENAHPTLLSWYCHDNGIDCAGLDAYIANREEYLADWMVRKNANKDDAKAHFLAIINGRRVKLASEDPDWYKEFYSGMRHITESIVKLRPELYELAKKSKDRRGTDYNIDGTAVNYVMCSLENRALIAAFDYLTEEGIEVGSLVFDGLMIYKDKVTPERLPEVLAGCTQKIKEVMGCDITFTNKDMDEGYDIPDEPEQTVEADPHDYMDEYMEDYIDDLEEIQEDELMDESDYLIEQGNKCSQRVNEDAGESCGAPRQAVNVNLLLRKGVYPYDYMDGFEKLQETKLPPREAFYSTLTDEGVSQADYEHAQQVWKEMGITSMREYHNLYLKTDVLLLCDVFENFRDVCMKHNQLDPAWYLSAPGLTYDAALKFTGVTRICS